MRVKVTQGHWKMKIVPVESLDTVSYSPSIVYGRIFSYFGDIQRQRTIRSWNLGLGSFKVIENGAVWYTMYVYDFPLWL